MNIVGVIAYALITALLIVVIGAGVCLGMLWHDKLTNNKKEK